MSKWPWMKGQKVAIADPVPPANERDDRPAVKDLIAEHRDKIERVRQELKDSNGSLYDPSKHDDLWIVRFLLSHKKNVKASVKAAKHTLEFRSRFQLDERDIRHIHMGVANVDEIPDPVKRYQDCCDPETFRFVVYPRCVVSYLKFSGFDQPKLVEKVDPDDWLPAYAFISEYSHQWVDFITRTTGRLTKTIRVVDLEGISLRKQCNPTAIHRDGKALSTMEDVYPQLLQALFLMHAPVWVEAPWRMLRPIIPKRVVTKFDFLEPQKRSRDFQKITKYVDPEQLPERYGGQSPVWPENTPPPKM